MADSASEDFNLRSAIIAYASTHNYAGGAISATHKDQLAANDVKWSHGKFDTTVATAAANGQIVIYDINRPGVEYGRLHEHVRQVHRIAFNPHQGALLLSGSQDATVRLWDLRSLAGDRSVMTCHSTHQYPGNNEGIRDLRWSPTNGVEFAAGTDNGVVQRWDFRKEKVPIVKVNAHEKTCHSIDWHPDGKHLVSGGADKCINVWDFSSADRRKKPCWQIRAPQAVLHVRWRPPSWNAEGANPGHWQCTHLAASYDNHDPRVHIWDFRRQHVPFQEIDRYDTAPTALLWHSEDLLWSAGSAGIFTQTDMNFAPKVSDRRSSSAVAIAPNGQIQFFSEKKAQRRRSLQDTAENFLNTSRKVSGSGERLSSSHSATDGSLEEPSLLSSSFKNRHRIALATRSSKSLSSTPPSAGVGGPVLKLDEAMRKELVFRHAQGAACGRILGLFDDVAFKFLAKSYKIPSATSAADSSHKPHRAACIRFMENASLATYVNQYQLAQSWKIISLAIGKDLRLRRYDTVRSDRHASPSVDLGKQPLSRNQGTKTSNLAEAPNKINSISERDLVHGKLKAPPPLENSSTTTTPLARPVADIPVNPPATGNARALDAGDILVLPGPAWEERRLQGRPATSSNVLDLSHSTEHHTVAASGNERPIDAAASSVAIPRGIENTTASTLVAGFPDMDHHMSERRAAMENYRARPRPLLRFDDPISLPRNLVTSTLDRHDSNESFQLFSASTDSSKHANSFAGSFGSSQDSDKAGRTPERWDIRTRRPLDFAGPFLMEGTRLAEMITSPPSNEPNFHAVASSINNSAPFSEGSPLLRPLWNAAPTVHYEDMEQPQNFEIPATNSGVNADAAHEVATSPPLTRDLDRLPPWTTASMLLPLITYHTTNLCSSQLPAHVLLQTIPQLSSTVPPGLVLSILLNYHAQLVSFSLYAQAAHLRKLAHPLYPDVSDYGSYGITPGGAWCTVCRKPSKGDKSGYCERCENRWADCPICDGEGPLASKQACSYGNFSFVGDINFQKSESLWGWCQWCGHGGHLACLRIWWKSADISEGGCATAGCLHDCVAGKRREEALKRKEESKKGATVKGDEWVVGESRAVERTRGLVAGEEGAIPRSMAQGQARSKAFGVGQGPLSIGMMGRSSSGGKKVRLLVPPSDVERLVKKNEGQAGTLVSASVP